jgi:hypothetical protein
MGPRPSIDPSSIQSADRVRGLLKILASYQGIALAMPQLPQ